MTSGLRKPDIYPEYCHELSPSIKRWCPLRAIDVHDLAEWGMFSNGRRLYHHGNHPIKWVRLTGLIVAVDEFAKKRVYTLDDSSGTCIECICPAPPTAAEEAIAAATTNTVVITKKSNETKAVVNDGPSVTNPNIPWDDLDVGTVVKIKGGINTFRDQKQVEIIKVEVLKSTDQEVRCWNEVLEFRKDVLRVPWILTPEQEEKCRRRAMKENSRALKKSSSKKHGEIKDKKLERVKYGSDKGKRSSSTTAHSSIKRYRGDETRNMVSVRESARAEHRQSRPRHTEDEAKKKHQTRQDTTYRYKT
ncbi:Nucleic acid-binding protein [Glarea lozoyensis ATCC 20868]|uniref:CST complex subunit STN1 n=1 Tax=Glarea lozoyensis (strain ATCC 20868 / MF5171) TaxID=1116229 RepID=S3DKG2_GLAL2|nr:Nucleic acid-binding protein [Glarea lozoyensis ATCC 20868]EPE27048.1 Nucleic acid-binding protein [Glarea lozoyensis ATCC 20868]